MKSNLRFLSHTVKACQLKVAILIINNINNMGACVCTARIHHWPVTLDLSVLSLLLYMYVCVYILASISGCI